MKQLELFDDDSGMYFIDKKYISVILKKIFDKSQSKKLLPIGQELFTLLKEFRFY